MLVRVLTLPHRGIIRVRHSAMLARQDQNQAGSPLWVGVYQQGPWTGTGMAVAELEPGISVNSLCRV